MRPFRLTIVGRVVHSYPTIIGGRLRWQTAPCRFTWVMSRFSISSLHKLLHKLSHNIDDESGGEAEDSENGLRPLALSWSRAPSSVKDAPGFQPWSPGASAWRGWKLPGLHRNLIAALSTNLWPEDKGSILVNFCPFHRTVTRHKPCLGASHTLTLDKLKRLFLKLS